MYNVPKYLGLCFKLTVNKIYFILHEDLEILTCIKNS